MDRRGDIPIIILVLGVLVVCSLALLSFYAANFNVANTFSGIKLVEKMESQIESNLYSGKPVDNLAPLEKTIPSGFLWLKKKVIFSVGYSPLGS